jgi:signal transduction histidine kinase
MLPLQIRSKLIVYTVLPVVAVYAILLIVGVTHVYDQSRSAAQQRLLTHARYQAARMALVLVQVPQLAGSIADLVAADPEQAQEMLYAHLIDGLRRTPIADAATVVFDNGSRSASMQRGGAVGHHDVPATLAADGVRGWHLPSGNMAFNRPIVRRGEERGMVGIAMRSADVRQALNRDLGQDLRLLLGPAGYESAIDSLAGQEADGAPTPLVGVDDIDRVIRLDAESTADGYWAVRTPLPDLPLYLTAVTPVESALIPVKRQVYRLITALVASLLLIILIIGIVARRFIEPLRILDASVRKIGQGEYPSDVVLTSNDELGRLSVTIGRMSGLIADREQALKQAQQVLEQKVEERTRALQAGNRQLLDQIRETRETERALRLANEKAEQASRAKSEFLSNMSHELRTPLHGVLGNAQILRRDLPHDSPAQENLVAIERSGQHLLMLINQILDLTRIESGTTEIVQQPSDIRRLVHDTELIVAQRARSKGLQLAIDIAADVPALITTDALRLRQVLLNLLDNAIKFTESGRIRLTLRAASPGRLRFCIEDTGNGIEPAEMQSIFEAFHQGSGRHGVSGTGLGLTITRRLILLLGGDDLLVDSRPGAGSRFWFEIPSAVTPAAPDAVGQDAALLPEEARSQNAAYAVLVIEADEPGRVLLADWLQGRGCTVASCATLAAAVDCLREEHFDALLIDVGANGPQAKQWATAIREVTADRPPRLVAISDDPAVNPEHLIRDAGLSGCLLKPFTEQELHAAIRPSREPLPVRDTIERSRAFLPLSSWPPKQAAHTAEHIERALKYGDVGMLMQLGERLTLDKTIPTADVHLLARMTAAFDFDGIRRFAGELRNGSGLPQAAE